MNTMQAIRVHAHGGPSSLTVDRIERPSAGTGQVRLRVEVAGVNFTDTYWRSGFYSQPLPYTAGVEAVGIVDQVGSQVDGVHTGQRMGFPQQPGAYAEHVVVEASRAVTVGPDMDAETACCLMMQGLTAHYLATSTFDASTGATVLVHAAAGGVGRLLVQMAALRGARVLAAVSTREKAAIATAAGADRVSVGRDADIVAFCLEATDGRGADAVYDAVGLRTFRQSLRSVRPRGLVVLYGQASGAVPSFDTLVLAERSIYLTRPRLAPHIADRAALRRRSADLFAWWADGTVSTRIDRRYPLASAAAAHSYLESGMSTGKVLLVPDREQR